VEVKSVAMQTEEIRIDKRLVKLPASLLPSAIPDRLNAIDEKYRPHSVGRPKVA
jgi:hypothetical protein